jgi:hypothetical protein
MENWVTQFIAQPQVNAKVDILCFDNHRSHVNEEIQKRLEKAGLKVLPFPKGAAADLSMLDNSLFRDFKRDFVKSWEKEKFDLEKKEEVAYDTWNIFPSERIAAYWKKCGYLAKPRYRRKIEKKVAQSEVAIKKKRKFKTIAGTAPITSFFSKA